MSQANQYIAAFLFVFAFAVVLFTIINWGHRFRLPFIIRSRVNDEWRKSMHDAKHERDQLVITQLGDRVAWMRHEITENEHQFKAGREQHLRLITAAEIERDLARVSVAENTKLRATNENLHEKLASQIAGAARQFDALRDKYDGDLMLERQRFDDFVRDMLDRAMPGPAETSRHTQSSSPQPRSLPSRVQSAIEDVSFGNLQLETHLENEAWKLLDQNVAPDEVAKRILAGERVE